MSSRRIVIVFAALLLAPGFACRKAGENVNTGAAGTSGTETSATATSGTDTSGTTTTSTAPSTTAIGSTGTTVSNLSDADKEFVTKAAQGGMAEVQLGQTAQSKATSPDVQAFARKMVDDHGKANDELKQLATAKGLAVPSDLDAEHTKVVDGISAKSGKAFDKAYMAEMVNDHDKTVKALEKESKSGQDADVKNWASKTLPTVQEHLRMARDTDKKVK